MSDHPSSSNQEGLFLGSDQNTTTLEGPQAVGRSRRVSISDNIPASPLEVTHALPGATPPSTMTEPPFVGVSSVVGMSVGNHLGSSTDITGRPLAANDNLSNSEAASARVLGQGIDGMSIAPSNPHQLNQLPLSDPPAAPCNERVRVIWGTNIVISGAIEAFKKFQREFTRAHRKAFEAQTQGPDAPLPTTTANDLEPYYPQLLRQIFETEIYNLNVDFANLRSYPPTMEFAKQLMSYPVEMIQLMDMVVNELYLEMFPEADGADPIQVRPFNTGKVVNMRDLNPDDLDKLITIKGLIIRVSNIIPDMRVAYFVCGSCGQAVTIESVRGNIAEPARCPRDGCEALHSMSIVHNRCLFSDKQLIKIQETPGTKGDAIPDGQTPHCVTLCVYDTLVDVARPGDRVEVTGIYRSSPVRVSSHQRKVKSLFRTFIDVVHLKRMEKDRLRLNPDNVMSAEEYMVSFDETDDVHQETLQDEYELCQLARQPNIYTQLCHSIAPSVWGLTDVKKGLLLQLFGGVSKVLRKSGSARFRGDINLLLAGDPGVSKSQLLQYVHKLAPRGIYTSGKGSSAVGLTAYITRDAESNQLVLESGALVLSDGGICCIDEFDKMSDETRAILHEVMEQQTVSIAKAGIITTLNARTSILASANPIESKYNASKSIVENLNLPPTILSRFDVIYLILDSVNQEEDARLSRHIISLYTTAGQPQRSSPSSTVDVKTLTKYISYARSLQPSITEEAARDLANGYVSMRKANGASNKTVSATTRQLESLIRLSEAHARMRLSATVDPQDVTEAIRLIREAMLSYAIDPLTGKIDMDLISTGKSSALRERQAELKKQIKAMVIDKDIRTIEFSTLAAEIVSQSSIPINEKWLRDVVEELVEEEFFTVVGNVRRGVARLNRA